MTCRIVTTVILACALSATSCSDDTATTVDTRPYSAGTQSGGAPTTSSECRLTLPGPASLPPVASATNPGIGRGWYVDDGLLTSLTTSGEVWDSLPRGPGGFSQKTFWWSLGFDWRAEPQPAISVTGRRLDGPGAFESSGTATHAIFEDGSAMLVGIEIPTKGCWELTASYRATSLSYVVRVE